MARSTTIERADHHASENHRTEAVTEMETKYFDLIPEEDAVNYENASPEDFNKLEEEKESEINGKVFDIMPERGDDEDSKKGALQLYEEIEVLDAMIERSAVGILNLQVMKEELEAKEREMEWKMSESMELKRAMEELKRKKSEELMGKEKALADGGKKTKWGFPALALMACVGIVAAAAAAVVLVGNVKQEKRSKKSSKIKVA